MRKEHNLIWPNKNVKEERRNWGRKISSRIERRWRKGCKQRKDILYNVESEPGKRYINKFKLSIDS